MKGVHSWQVADDWLDDPENWVIQLRKERPEEPTASRSL